MGLRMARARVATRGGGDVSDAMHHKSLQPGYRRALADAKAARLNARRQRDAARMLSVGVRIAQWVLDHGCQLPGQTIARRINAIIAAKARQERSFGRAQGWNAAKGVKP